MEKVIVYRIKQQDIDLITDKNVENEVCLGFDNYEFIGGSLKVKNNTTLSIPVGTTLIITDK